jgi:PAS domain S-box-containing protein
MDSNNKLSDDILRDSPFAWWEWDIRANTVRFNDLKVSMLGYSAEKFKGRGYEAFTELLHPGDYERTMNAMRDVLCGRKAIYQVDYRILASNNEYKWYMDRGVILEKDSAGKPLSIRGMVIDLGLEAQAGNDIEVLVQLLTDNARQTKAVITVCSGCKKIKSKEGVWLPVTQDLSRMIGLPLSHGICPDCIYALYPEIADNVMKMVKAIC